MGLFSKIRDRILGRNTETATSPGTSSQGGKPAPVIFDGGQDDPKVAPPALKPAPPAPAPAPEPVDVEAVLAAMARLAATQHSTSSLALQQARAYQAARAGRRRRG